MHRPHHTFERRTRTIERCCPPVGRAEGKRGSVPSHLPVLSAMFGELEPRPSVWQRGGALLVAPVQWAVVRLVLMLDIAVQSRALTRSIPALHKRAMWPHAALGALLLGDFVLVPMVSPLVRAITLWRIVFLGVHAVLLLGLAWWYVRRASRCRALALAHEGRVCIECLAILPLEFSCVACPACHAGFSFERNWRLWQLPQLDEPEPEPQEPSEAENNSDPWAP